MILKVILKSKGDFVKKIIIGTLMLSTSMTYADTMSGDENILEKAYDEVKELNESGLYKPHLAIISGVSDPVDNGYDAGGLLAVEAGYQMMVPYGVGIEVSTQDYDKDNGTDLTRTQMFLKGSYNFGGDTPVIKYSYIGLGLGMVSENSDDTATYGAIMPNAGFDIPLTVLSEQISLGANLRYTATASNEADSFGLNGVVKYWF